MRDSGRAAVGTYRQLWRGLRDAAGAVSRSEIGGKLKLLVGSVLVLLVGINGLNVLGSYVGGYAMTAVEQRSLPRFFTHISLWAGVFAALTVAAVLVRFIEERTALLWRKWLTERLVSGYLSDGAYLRIKARADLGNPDQRITDDARAFTATTLSFVLMLVNALFGIIAFSGVLWSISPALFLLAVGYAAAGSLTTVLLGRPLLRLNYDQSDREASFRSELVHAGENAESLLLLKLEGRLQSRLRRRLEALVSNMKQIVAVNKNLGLFTTGYNYGIQLLPPLVVGPLFIAGKVELGVITQSAIAFSQLLGAFSLIINQFGSISSYAAVLVRLGDFSRAIEQPPHAEARRSSAGPGCLVYRGLTLDSREGGPCLVRNLELTISPGAHLLVTGTEEARRELFHVTALGRHAHRDHLMYPEGNVLFLPERPYVPPATLRELVVRHGHERDLSDAALLEELDQLGLGPALRRVGGLDVEGDFSHALSLGEQQLLAIARVLVARPAFVVLHNPGTTLAPEQLALALRRLGRAGVTYVTFGASEPRPGSYDAVLELHAGGAWSFRDRRQTHLVLPDVRVVSS